ncbi:MAG: response regulator [Verrucomicrobia bacterium]|nr:response regulator [Verrucomicrobiota bacterium]
MPSKKIIFVDDDPNLLAAMQRNLRKQFTFDTAPGGAEALHAIKTTGPYAVIVADMQMPEMNGVELLSKVCIASPDTVRVMLTGNADQLTATEAVNKGRIFSFLNKPCEPETLKFTLEAALKQHELVTIERELLEGTLTGAVKVLGEVLAMVDPSSFGRGQKLRDSVRIFAKWLGLPSTWEYEMAALLANIGLVSVPPIVLRKLDQGFELTARERDLVENAPQIGHDLLIHIPRLEPVAKNVLYQGKHYNGAGFPADKVAGEGIPMGARMLKILHDRAMLEAEGVVKKHAHDAMKARHHVYDPTLLDKCFECFESFLANAISSDRAVLPLAVHELQPDVILVSDIKTKSDVLLIAAGNRLTEIMISRLNNYANFDPIKEPIYVQSAVP